MPFRQFASSFQPHQLELLGGAFDSVWQQLSDIGAVPHQEELAAELRSRLALTIVIAARNGEWDPKRLSELALERISNAAIQPDKPGVDAKECRENSTRCSQLATSASSPKAREVFEDLGRTWLKLAVDLEASQTCLGKEPNRA